MADVLYGIKMGILEELDETTQLPPTSGGTTVSFTTAESAEMEPVVSEGEEEVKRTDDIILAIVSTPDLLYGYDITLTDNTFNVEMAALIEGGVVTTNAGEVTGYDTPALSDGCTTKLFRLTLYVANYEGDSIKNYVKIVFNKCRGTAATMSIGKEFYAPEFSVKAREATKAGLKIRNITYVDALPAIV